MTSFPHHTTFKDYQLTTQTETAQSWPIEVTHLGKFTTWKKVDASMPLIPDSQSEINQCNLFIGRLEDSRINNLTTYFGQVRNQLNRDQLLCFTAIMSENTKQALYHKFPKPIFYCCYFFRYFYRRVLPVLLRKYLTLKRDVSKTEVLGRAIHQGLSIVICKESDGQTIFVVKKSQNEGKICVEKPNEGLLFSTRRVGKDKKKIMLYKLRSMHPYAEFVQEYIHQQHGLKPDGKFNNDFRVSTGGKFLRKYWVDEIPMLFNLLKGDLKLVGVRPLTEHYFNLYPTDMQELRSKTKPGLLPPFYADLPNSFEQILLSEERYLLAYLKNPIITDFRYLVAILFNILLRNVRSM